MGRLRSRSRSRSVRAPSSSPVSGRTDFGGEKVNIVQVGLGNNATFLQNLGGKFEELDLNIQWLLRSMTEMEPERISGIGVEPVGEHINGLSQLASDHFENVALVQVALGEREESDKEMHVFTSSMREELLKQELDPRDKRYLNFQFEYLVNMSSVGSLHPEIPERLDAIKKNIGTQFNSTLLNPQQRKTEVWTWKKLSRTLNFSGCELLLVDAEGHDAMILRSMIDHCKDEEEGNPNIWPDVIQLETMGLCDRIEGNGTEWNIIGALQGVGYVMLHYSNFNTKLAHGRILNEAGGRIWWWASRNFYCVDCQSRNCFPYADSAKRMYCRWCCDNWSYDAVEEEALVLPISVADLTQELRELSAALEKTLKSEALYYVRGDDYALLNEVLAHARASLGKTPPPRYDRNYATYLQETVDSSTLDAIRKIVRASHSAEKDFPFFQMWQREGEDYWIRLGWRSP